MGQGSRLVFVTGRSTASDRLALERRKESQLSTWHLFAIPNLGAASKDDTRRQM